MGSSPEQPQSGDRGLRKRSEAVTGGWKCDWGWRWGIAIYWGIGMPLGWSQGRSLGGGGGG